jgi:translocation and assembly module TamB
MRRTARWAVQVLGGLVLLAALLLALLLAVVVGGSATQPGRTVIERLVPSVSGGMVRVTGLSGWLFADARISRIEVSDAHGPWLTIDDLTLNWSPLRLFGGEVMVQRIAADRVAVTRRPVFPAGNSNSTVGLPVRVDIAALHVGRVDLATPVVGQVARSMPSLTVDGMARLQAIDAGTVRLAVHCLDGAGAYTLDASLNPAGMHAALHLGEPAGGLVGSLATLPAIGAITADATLDGKLSAIATNVTLTAGELRARVTGQIDATGRAANLEVSADAPAMAPRADLSWRGITLKGHLNGPFDKPEASATLVGEGLSLGQAGIARITADIQGNAGRLTLSGALDGIRLPGPQPSVLEAAPLDVAATLQLDAADRPVTFRLQHPLFGIDGTAAIAGQEHAEVHLNVPEIAPLAAAGGVAVAGRVALTLRADRQGEDTRVAVQGNVGVTSPLGPVAALLGQDTTLDVLASLHGQTVRLSRLNVASGAFSADMTGTVAPGALDLDWRVAVTDVTKIDPAVNGPFSATGKASGSADNVTVTADLTGDIGTPGISPGKITAQVRLAGLPNAPTGDVSAHGTLLGAPLELSVAAARENGPEENGPGGNGPGGDGTGGKSPAANNLVRVVIERADWKSAHAGGTLLIRPAAVLPQGQVSFAMTRLDDLQPLLGRALRGGISGKLDSTAAGASLTLTATGAGLPGTATVARAVLDAKIGDPTGHPNLNGSLTLDGIAASGVIGSARIEAKGSLDALALRLTAKVPALAGAPAGLDAAATVDASAHTATITSVQADWTQVPIRLLAPTRISFANGLSVQGLRIGLRQAVLEATGRISPTLNLTARLRDVPAGLAALANPGLAMNGTLDAEVTLTGSPARPGGTIRVTARALRLASGPGRAMPAADLTVAATLRGLSAQLNLRATAGTAHLTVDGTAPLTTAGALDLRAAGSMDLAITDPVLTPGGRRARGRISLDATATGTMTEPRLNGTLQLADGSFRDFAHGIDLESINASVAADGGTVRVTRFTAKAGPGSIEANGSLDLTAPDRPLDLTLTAHDARPLSNDLVTATIDADLTLRGGLGGALTAAGKVFVRRADIRIPERLPTSVPTLDVRVAGAPPPPPAAPAPDIALNLTIDAPEQIFVRGRGVNAELGGTVHLQGSAANLIPSGGFTLRQGDFSIAGQTLTFQSGKVSFDGGSLTDPSLNLSSTTTASEVTATLTIAGTASKPKITLSSVPSLPQDEILAYLLYGQKEASLGPLQIAEIATTLASLAGAGPTMSNPLESLRTTLGLDRLTIGSGSSVEAGRYVARRVYVGAKQSVTGTGTQAVVQIDLAKGLKLQATAGNSTNQQSATGAGGSAGAASVGITYEFAY